MQLRFEGAVLLDAGGQPRPWPQLALFGDPVEHSLSPRLHEAALAARGIEAEYRAIRVRSVDLGNALRAAAEARVRGVNLTLPLKERGLQFVRRRTDEVDQVGATNTLVLRRGEWTAHNTDARGMAMALQRDLGSGLSRALRRCAVLGAGGAARAAVVALQGLGAASIEVVARDVARAAWAVASGARVLDFDRFEARRATLVVNCTPLGLAPEDPAPVDPGLLHPTAYVLDLTYGSSASALLRGFGGRGQDGRAMLVAQAALAFSVWYGALPPLPEMAASVDVQW